MYHNINSVAIYIFNFPVKWYAICFSFGIILAYIYGKYIISKTYLKNINIENALLILVICSIVFARLFFCIFYFWDYYQEYPIEIIKTWKGGLSFHGAMIGAIFGTFILHRLKISNFFVSLDLIAVVAPIIIFFGRIGNFINGELYGRMTNVPWGIIFDKYGYELRHPSQLYEAFFEGFVLFIILNIIFRIYFSWNNRGLIALCFLFCYSIFRFFIEFFREPDIQMGYFLHYFTYGQLLCAVTICFGLLAYFIVYIFRNVFRNG